MFMYCKMSDESYDSRNKELELEIHKGKIQQSNLDKINKYKLFSYYSSGIFPASV